MFKGLIELKTTLGHVEVPKGCEFLGVSLYDWAKEQRKRYKDSRRRRHAWRTKIKRLRELGFDLTSSEKRKSSGTHAFGFTKSIADNEEHWSMMLEGRKEYQKMTGNLDVPPGCEFHGFSLYDWVRKQKHRYRSTLHGEKAPMLPSRKHLLDAIGFGQLVAASAAPTAIKTAQEPAPRAADDRRL
jgi:hypothetical protein